MPSYYQLIGLLMDQILFIMDESNWLFKADETKDQQELGGKIKWCDLLYWVWILLH